MRFLFVSAQLPGHLDWGGFLATAQVLHRHGHEVQWVSGHEVEDHVTNAGITFSPIGETGWRWPPPPPQLRRTDQSAEAYNLQRQRRSLDQWLEVERVSTATGDLFAVASRFGPDIVVCEMFMAAAALTAEMLDVPLAVAGWPAPQPPDATVPKHPLVELSRERLSALLDEHNLAGVNWTKAGPAALCSPHLHLSFFSAAWHGDSARYGAETRLVGGVAPTSPASPPAEMPNPGDAPWVLITLGTSFNRDPNFFAAAANAADRVGGQPILVCGPNADMAPILARVPATLRNRLHFAERIDFAVVLPYTSAAIHHGGAGTTHALIMHAIPQLVIPHAGDQLRQAQGVARTGCGFHIAPRQATIENLAAALAELLPDRSAFRRRARFLADEFTALGGPVRAAALLEMVAAGNSAAV